MKQKTSAWLGVSIPSLILAFSYIIPQPALSNPVGQYVSNVRPLDKPGLFLVNFFTVQSYGNSVSHRTTYFTYRVYCPTQMVRNVTNENWGVAQKAHHDRDAGFGTMTKIVRQVCG
jgi:hypothetical protein